MYIIYFKNGTKLRITEEEYGIMFPDENPLKFATFIKDEKQYLTINANSINFIIDEKLESERIVKEFSTTFMPTIVPNNTGTQWGKDKI